MPGDVAISTPHDVMPIGLSSQFTFDVRLDAFDNKYPDGSSDRAALAQIPRRYFTLTRPLSTVPPKGGGLSQWQALRNFYFAHIGRSFYFYVARETVPPWTADPTGQAPDGRYTVVFDSAWSETLGLGRSSADFQLREVADGSTRTHSDS
jgi:hypothetical protein